MAEVLVQFDTTIAGPDGTRYVPSACGREAGALWEGWIEFAPAGGAEPLRTERETVQPNRADLRYWAEGLTQVFLEGALVRAIGRPAAPERDVPRPAHFDGPRPAARAATGAGVRPRAVLDPFATYAQGGEVLVSELGALDTERVRDIVLAYELAEPASAATAERDVLVAAILDGVRAT